MGLQLGVEPEFVGGRYRSHGWTRMAAEYDPGQIFTVDGFRNRSPEIGRSKPGLPVRRQRRAGDLIEPHFLGIQRCTSIVRHGWILSNYFVEILGVERVDEMNFAARQAEHL